MRWALLVLLLFGPASQAAEIDDAALRFCRARCDSLAAALQTMLHDDLLSGGLHAAAVSCAEKAPKLCSDFSRPPALEVERVTLASLAEKGRSRSPEAAWLRAIVEVARKGGEVPEERYGWVEEDRHRRFLYLRPLRIDPTCLQCHGPAAMVPPDVKELMRTRYHALPSENAVGDVKGALLVTLRFPEGERLLKESQAGKEPRSR
jgi:hypothetical protein